MNQSGPAQTVITTDVLVLGAGGAGMCAALKARESGADVLMVDKCGIGYNGQVPIGGGILAYVYPDRVDQWVEKVTRGSHFFNNQDWTHAFGSRMHQSTMDLADMGLTFLKKDGEIDILTWGPTNVTLFDAPKSLVALKKTAAARGVRMMDKIFVVDLLKNGDQVVGAVALGLVDGRVYVFNAKAVDRGHRQLRLPAREDLRLGAGRGAGHGLPGRRAGHQRRVQQHVRVGHQDPRQGAHGHPLLPATWRTPWARRSWASTTPS